MKNKEQHCPVTGLPVLLPADFNDINIGSDYYISLKKIGDSIVYIKSRGDLKNFNLEKVNKIIGAFCNSTNLSSHFVQIIDLEGVIGRLSFGNMRKQMRVFFKHHERLLGFVFIAEPSWLRPFINHGLRINRPSFKVYTVKNYSDAITTALGIYESISKKHQVDFPDKNKSLQFKDVIFKKEWIYNNKKTEFCWKVGAVPRRLIYVSLHGIMNNTEDVKNAFGLTKEIILEYNLQAVPFIALDYTGLKPITSIRVRQKLANEVKKINKETGNSEAVHVIINPDRFNRIAIKVFAPLVQQKFVIVDSVREAFRTINSYSYNMPAEDNIRDIVVSSEDLEELSKALTMLQWDNSDTTPEVNVSPENPLAYFAESLELVKSDINELRKNERKIQEERLKESEHSRKRLLSMMDDINAAKLALEKNFQFQRTISEISSRFVLTSESTFNDDINFMLSQIGKSFMVDRSYLFQYTNDYKFFSNTHEWCKAGISSQISNLQKTPVESLPWINNLHFSKSVVHIPDTENLPKEAFHEMDEFKRQNIKSLICIPVKSAEKLWGFIGFDAVENHYTWSENEIHNLTIIANIVSDVLLKIDSDKKLIEAKEKAEESERLKSAFLSNMSHEIRTPLNGIVGFTSLLGEENLTADNKKQYVEIIQKSCNRLLDTLNDILNISQIETGLMKVYKENVNINEQVQDVFTFFKPDAEAKNIDFVCSISLSDEKAKVVTDSEKLYSILSNLVNNAIKFTENGKIELGYEIIENKLRFFVKDTGIGIPIDRQEVIFNRFVKADIANNNAHQGSGLGLSISKAYAEMLGGKIWVDSKKCEGSTFFFTLSYEEEKQI